MRDVGDKISTRLFDAFHFGYVMQDCDYAAIRQRLGGYGKASAAVKGSGNRVFAPAGFERGIQCGKKIGVAKQFDHRRSDANTLMNNAADRLVGPANLQIGGDRDHAVGHAVEQRLEFGAAFPDGGEVFFQPASGAIQRARDLGNLVTTALGDVRREITRGDLLGKINDAAQAPRNQLCNRDRQQHRQKQRQQGGAKKGRADLSELILDAGKRIRQSHHFVTAEYSDVKKFNADRVAEASRAAGLSGQRGSNLGPAGVILHGFRVGFRIGKHHTVAGNDGGAGFSNLRLFYGHLLQGMLMIVGHAQSEALGVLHQKSLNVGVQRVFPDVANCDVKGKRGGSNYRHKGRQGFQKNAVSHLAASNLYPAPRTVLRYRGSSGSRSIFSRSRRIYTSTERGVTKERSRHTASRIWSREKTRPGCEARKCSRRNSVAVTSAGWPRTESVMESPCSSKSGVVMLVVSGCSKRRRTARTRAVSSRVPKGLAM